MLYFLAALLLLSLCRQCVKIQYDFVPLTAGRPLKNYRHLDKPVCLMVIWDLPEAITGE